VPALLTAVRLYGGEGTSMAHVLFHSSVPVGTKYFTVYSMCAGAMSIAREQAERLEQEAVRQSSELCFQDGVRALLGKSPQNFLGGRSKTPRPFEISVGWV
jgi:hypothetical protein